MRAIRFTTVPKLLRMLRILKRVDHLYPHELAGLDAVISEIESIAESAIPFGMCCHWRFKGQREYVFGWPTKLENGLVRMGSHAGDLYTGIIVDPSEIEIGGV
jgi:hypothetical protein